MFISRAVHVSIRLFLEIAIIDLININVYNSMLAGDR
jgi:hypothetical protein